MKMIKNQSGQTTVEYILLIAVVVGIFIQVVAALNAADITGKITKPMREDFRRAYQYGHPKARGFEDRDGPYLHPRIVNGDQTFRIFINATKQ